MTKDEARIRAWALYRTLERITSVDAEQEVSGIAVPVLDALLEACKQYVVTDPIVRAIDGLMTPQAVEDGHVRAWEASLVVQQLALALGPEIPAALPVSSRSRDRLPLNW